MKSSRSSTHCKAHTIPKLQVEEQTLTSFAGLVMFQAFFTCINLKAKLRQCFDHLKSGKIFGHTAIFLQLLIHILLGYRELRDSRFYRDDPLIKRLLGLKHLPNVATISRMLKDADEASVEKLRAALRDMVLERMTNLALPLVTLDFDGSVQLTGRFSEGTAVGFNKKKREREVTTRSFVRSLRPVRYWTSYTGRVMCTTQEARKHSF